MYVDIVPVLRKYVGSAKSVRIMSDAADEIDRLRDSTERYYGLSHTLLTYLASATDLPTNIAKIVADWKDSTRV
jgi:hypothetical protein